MTNHNQICYLAETCSEAYMLRVHANGTDSVREIIVSSYDYAVERFVHYRDKWTLFKFATMSHFDGFCWCEIPLPA